MEDLADDDRSVGIYGDVATLEEFVTAVPACRYDDMAGIAFLCVAALCALLDVRRDQELDIETASAEVAAGLHSREEQAAQVVLLRPALAQNLDVEVTMARCR